MTISLFILIGQAIGVSDTYESILFHPFTMDWSNADCILSDDDVRNCDPVNLLFPDLDVNQVKGALELQGGVRLTLGVSRFTQKSFQGL